MTKLGVHESPEEKEKEKEAGDAVKVDPKVFTVLQPTVIPLPAQPPAPPRRSIIGFLIRGLLLFLLFIACITALLVFIYGVDTVYSGVTGVRTDDSTTTVAPQPLGLVNPMGMNQKADENTQNDGEVKVYLNAVPVAKLVVVEGGSTSSEEAKDNETNERPVHPYEAQEMQFAQFRGPVMNVPPPMLALQARQMAYAQAVRQWRMRRLQQAIYEQQMLREAMARAEWMENQRRAAAEEELARNIAQARWEQTQRARAAEEYQAEMQRAQWAQAQRAMWERAQMMQMHQQMHNFMHGPHGPMMMYWQHPWYILQQQKQQQMQQQQQQQQAQQQQQQQQQAQQPQQPQQQPQQQQFFYQQPQYQQQWYYYPQQQQFYQQQQQAQQFYQNQQPWVNNQQQQQQQPQQQQPQQQATVIIPQREWAIPRIAPQQQEPQIPMRPHDASPAQILSMQQPTVPPAPEMGLHDKIYQEMQKKSQGMEFNVPSRPIWTAITPTPETPGNYDHDAIFQENLRKIQEMQTTTIAPMSPSTEKVAEIKQVESDNVFRDILSVFDDAEKKEEPVTTTTENVFKAFSDDKSTEAPKLIKEPASEVVDSAAQVETSTETVFKPAEIPKPEENIFKIVEEAKPEMNIFKQVDQAKPEEIHVPDPDEDEGPPGPVVVEDRFPRIEDRTTVPVEASTAAPQEQETDEDMEHDPLAAFLRYFEQEAQKINEARGKPAVVDSEVRKEDMKADQPAAVDEPEPNFEMQQPQIPPRLITV
ncbi:unnamed protein product [Cylicocyclus nassatus]|uniref:Uncharacterized protein n=1 Tax=Cylicocyclus nassatus TaxID=53992 RepID=A0AA36GW76_CYLNA|nr:unnamed protein product [Cylicocyclus nassatus]